MSYLAMGAVTRSIVELLTRKINRPPLFGSTFTFRVSCLPPDDDRVGEETGVNLFLYRVVEHPFLKNAEWRGDRLNPNGSRRPPLTVTLNYLMTAYARREASGAQDDVTAHQILGNAMSVLHDHPVLNDVHDGDFDANIDTMFAPELRNAFDKVKVTLSPVSMDEFSKIWTGLSKAYRLSVGYEVSLAQIAPLALSRPVGPPPQIIGLQVTPIAAPEITGVSPVSGPSGATITLTGGGFVSPTGTTRVVVGGVMLEASQLTRLTPHDIVFPMPRAVQGGPLVPIAVDANGLTSAPALYELRPWIEILRPPRGLTRVPVTCGCDVPPGTAVTVSIGGVASPSVTLNEAGTAVRAIVPAGVTANGPQEVVMTVPGAPPQPSNALAYEVVPHITNVAFVTAPAPPSTTLTIDGERLAGADVRVQYGAVAIRRGENATANQIVVTVDRVLPVGQPVSVVVDGRESNPLPPRITSLQPAAAARGDAVVIAGAGLSGEAVVVAFDGTTVAVGPHPIPSRLETAVPASAAGVLQVTVTVDGHVSNAVPFEVLT